VTETNATSNQTNLETYSSEKYTFTYPSDYTITLPDVSFPVLTIEKASNKRMEIFQMKDFGDRPFGFTGEETQEEIDGYLPKERLTVGTGENQYNVWLFFSKGDRQTKEDLNLILESIEIKQ
jgi:Ulp1 family protease